MENGRMPCGAAFAWCAFRGSASHWRFNGLPGECVTRGAFSLSDLPYNV